MRGIAGLAGWQWVRCACLADLEYADGCSKLFIIEGIFTIIVGFAFIIFFPRHPANPVSFCRFGIFTERERNILVQRVLRDDSSKRQPRPHIPWIDVKRAVR
jgi:hypothetical protein